MSAKREMLCKRRETKRYAVVDSAGFSAAPTLLLLRKGVPGTVRVRVLVVVSVRLP